jgi:hypothetical protein
MALGFASGAILVSREGEKSERKLHPRPQADNLTNWLINSIREYIAFPCGTLFIDMQQDLKWGPLPARTRKHLKIDIRARR